MSLDDCISDWTQSYDSFESCVDAITDTINDVSLEVAVNDFNPTGLLVGIIVALWLVFF